MNKPKSADHCWLVLETFIRTPHRKIRNLWVKGIMPMTFGIFWQMLHTMQHSENIFEDLITKNHNMDICS